MKSALGCSFPATEANSEAGNWNIVTTLARGFSILRAFGPNDEYLGNADLAQRTNLPKSTVSRLTNTLTRLGYLYCSEPREKYRLGPGVLALGFSYLNVTSGIRQLARPYMERLADDEDVAVALGAPDQFHMTYIELCQGHGPLIMRHKVGTRLPMVHTSMRRAYISALPEARRLALMAQLREHLGDEWPAIEKVLAIAYDDYHTRGFCLSVAEFSAQVSAVGVPLILDDENDVLVFNCGGAAQRVTRELLENNLGLRLQALVRSLRMQFRGPRI